MGIIRGDNFGESFVEGGNKRTGLSNELKKSHEGRFRPSPRLNLSRFKAPPLPRDRWTRDQVNFSDRAMNFVPRKCLNGEHACRVIVGRLIFELDVEQRPPLLSFSSFFFFSTRKRNEERDHRGSRTTRFSNNTIGTLVADDPTKSIEK